MRVVRELGCHVLQGLGRQAWATKIPSSGSIGRVLPVSRLLVGQEALLSLLLL